jgi:AraC-like DNA-binding protein
MARRRKDPAVPHHLVPALVRYLRRRGGDADALIRRFKLPADVEQRPDASITVVEFDALLAAVSVALGDPFLALRLPAELELTRYNFAELAAGASPTWRDALERMVRFASLVNRQVQFALEEIGDEAIWTQRVLGHPRGVGRHADLYSMASGLFHARRAVDGRVVPRRVWFMHERPEEVTPLERFFGTRHIAFGRSENGLAFDRSLLDTPMATADRRLLETAEGLARVAVAEQPAARDLAGEVAARVRRQLRDRPDLRALAKELRMSARTLQRKLEEQGMTWKNLVDGVRNARARELLDDDTLSLGEIAFELGFSDEGTFGRAFRRWTGVAPGAYRTRRAPRR